MQFGNFNPFSRQAKIKKLRVSLVGFLVLTILCSACEPMEVNNKLDEIVTEIPVLDPVIPTPLEAETSTEEIVEGLTEPLTPAQQQWNGYWFGSLWIPEIIGPEYEEMAGDLFDYYVFFEVDREGDGFMDGKRIPFDPSEEYTSEFSMWIEADEYHFEQVRDEAWFFNMDIIEGENGEDFWFGPTPDNKDAVVMAGKYLDPDFETEEGFEFIITIFRWGSTWDFEVSNNPPPGYEDYLEAVASNMEMPDLVEHEDEPEETVATEPESVETQPVTERFPNQYETEQAILYYPDGGTVETTMFGDTKIVYSDEDYTIVAREGLDLYEKILENYKNSTTPMTGESLEVDSHEATIYKYADEFGPCYDLYVKMKDGETFVVQFCTVSYSGGIEKLDNIPQIMEVIRQIDILD